MGLNIKRHRATSWDELGWRQTPIGGRTAHIWMDEEDESGPYISTSEFPAGSVRGPHMHEGDYAEFILKGSQQVTGHWYNEGDIRVVKAGTGYGPLIAGPEGCTVMVVFRHGNKRLQVNLPRKKTPAAQE